MGRPRGVLALGVGTVAIAMTLTACGASGSNSGNQAPNSSSSANAKALTQKITVDYNPQPRSKIEDGGTVTLPLAELPSQENTMASGGSVSSAQLWDWYNPQLDFLTPQGKWSFNKDYLTDVTEAVKNGNTTVTYTLNPKAVWNDGTPMTWMSYYLTWKSCNGGNATYQSAGDCSTVKSVTKGVNDRQAIVTYKGIFAWWQSNFGEILNPHITSPQIFNNAYQNKLVAQWGAGPYTVDSANFQTGRIAFKRNPRWWGPAPKLNEVIYQQEEETAETNAFKNGEIDLADVSTKDALDQVSSMSGITIHRSTSQNIGLLILNATRPELKDVNVRKAILEGIDRQILAKIQYNGLGYTGSVGGSLLLLPYQSGYVDAVTAAGYKYSPADANKLLDQAGWKKGSDGIREKNGQKLSLQLPLSGDDPSVIAQGKAMISMEKQIGVQINIKQIASADFVKDLDSGNWDAFSSGFAESDPYGAQYVCYFYCSKAAGAAAAGNTSGSGTTALNKQMMALDKIADPNKQTQAALKLETQWYQQTWGELPTTNGPAVFATTAGLANLAPVPFFGLAAFGSIPVENFGWEKGSGQHNS